METVKEFEYLRVLSYLLVPMILALLLPHLAAPREPSRTTRRLRQLIVVLPTLLAAGYTYLFFFHNLPGEQAAFPAQALPPLPGIVWCLFIVYLAHFLADHYRAAGPVSQFVTPSIPLGAWVVLASAWLLCASAALVLLPDPPAFAGYLVLAMGLLPIAGGPLLLSRLSFQPREKPAVDSPAAGRDQAMRDAWQIFAVLGIVAFGQIALAVAITLDRSAVLGGNPVQAGRYTWIVLAALALYAGLAVLCVLVTRRRPARGRKS